MGSYNHEAMEARPKINIELTPADKILESSGWILLAALWLLTIYAYIIIQGDIPTHFDASGNVNSHGSKSTIFLLPVLGTIVFIGLSILNRYPQNFNYIRINQQNPLAQYTYATRMIRSVKTGIILIFSLIILFTYLTATGKIQGMGIWFLPFTLLIIMGPTAYYIAKSLKANQ